MGLHQAKHLQACVENKRSISCTVQSSTIHILVFMFFLRNYVYIFVHVLHSTCIAILTYNVLPFSATLRPCGFLQFMKVRK